MSATVGIVNDIKETFKRGNMLTRLIYINLAVFLAVKVVDIFTFLFAIDSMNFLVEWLAVPAGFSQLIMKPWSLFTYMFLHQGFFHLLFNMAWLYWLGKIFLEYLSGKQLLNVYLLGGLSGAVLYIIAFNVFPAFQQSLEFSYALGASAAVMAVVVATAVYVPNYSIHLLFLGAVRLKVLAAIFIFMDVIFLVEGNAGGHIAHLGGALWGWLFVTQLKKGKDIGRGFGQFLDDIASWTKPKSKMKVTYKRGESDLDYNNRKNQEQGNIDAILEKIAKSGYESLSKKEKDLLFKHSKKS